MVPGVQTAPLPSAPFTAHSGQNPCLRHVGLLGGTWGLWSATHYMSSVPHLAQNDKTKLQNPDGESHSPVKAGHPALEREESQESACFLCVALEGSLSELLGRPSWQLPDEVAQAGPGRPASRRDSRGQACSPVPGMLRRGCGVRGIQGWPPAQTGRQLQASWPLPGGHWGP